MRENINTLKDIAMQNYVEHAGKYHHNRRISPRKRQDQL